MRKIYLLDLFDLLSMSEGMFEKKSAAAPKREEDWTKTVEEFEKDGLVTKKETWISKDGSSRYTRSYIESRPDHSKSIAALEEAMKLAVEKKNSKRQQSLETS